MLQELEWHRRPGRATPAGDFHWRLATVQTFDPIVRLVNTERERFPELQKTFTTGLELDQWKIGWADHPLPGIVMAALVGYGQLSNSTTVRIAVCQLTRSSTRWSSSSSTQT